MALRLVLSACKQQQPLLMKQLLPAACAALQAAPAGIQGKASVLLPCLALTHTPSAYQPPLHTQ
jgi:hypothetical protein